ncbi:uncharacterized protein BJ171DRAFT_575010 [Polychytrium aggregatum]|uniref:uncharacterized protein n=2 Tax=Polychytrium aggregatum TaxID=110093 RepID=UPI0022FDFC99|nr:uncharacterized protein BJ171DRAFT_575010 [Polychytrium aggregatum]KAI9190546.1 hypothetical protein BJ171DRAFT_575010 [Polychytrium aggregatum]
MSSLVTKRITRSMSTRATKRQRLHEQLISLGIEETYPILLAVLSIPELIEMLPACSLAKLKATSSDVRALLSTKTVGIRIWAEWFNKQHHTRLLSDDCVQLVKYFPTGPVAFDVKWLKTIPKYEVSAEFVRVACHTRLGNPESHIVQRLLEAKHIPTAMWVVENGFCDGEIHSKCLSVLTNRSEALDDFLVDHRNIFLRGPSVEIAQAYFQWLKSLDASKLKIKYTFHECYRFGRGTDANPTRALDLLVECARSGYHDSVQQIYDICRYGWIRHAPHASSIWHWLSESSGHSLPERDRNLLSVYCMKNSIGFPRWMTCKATYQYRLLMAYRDGSKIARQQILSISPSAPHNWDRPDHWVDMIALNDITAARNDPQVQAVFMDLLKRSIMVKSNGAVLWSHYERLIRERYTQ